MTVAVGITRGGPRLIPGRRTTGRLVLLAILFTVVAIGGDPMPAAGDEDVTTFGLTIPPTVKTKLVSPFEPRYVVDGGLESTEHSVPAADVAEVSVATNTPDWGLAVRFSLPETVKPVPLNVAARCRLVDEAGIVVSEQFIENGEVLLEGNGRRGHHTLFLEVIGLYDAFGIETLTEPMVDVEGWLATGIDP